MDFIMWNGYYETWYKKDVPTMEENLRQIHRAFPDKPIVISEYGYCECHPAHVGGDPKRIDILLKHNKVFRAYDWVGGTIFFSYNDYRTHIGDKGIGPLKQRVHGVVDLYGERKPSFEELRRDASPIESLRAEVSRGKATLKIRTRRRLPGYTLRGYSLRWIVYGFGGLPMESGETDLPSLAPGAEGSVTINFASENPRRIRLDIMRPTRFSAATVTLEV
jgi:beta-glucuronidase